MENTLGTKLIAVIDIAHLVLYEAQGLKITTGPNKIDLNFDKHHRQEKTQSFYQKKSGPGSHFDPHTDAKDLEHMESAKEALEHIEQALKGDKYQELYIAAEPKMLGALRQEFGGTVKKLVSKEVAKNLVQQPLNKIEQAIFA